MALSSAYRLYSKLGLTLHAERRAAARLAAAALAIAVLGFGGCAQSPPQIAATHHPKEYFPSSVYGPASRRVVADGEAIPHGGGQYLVGKPYTIAGQTYYPSERKVTQVGLASWYGDAFHGRLTANGEIYDRNGFTAAHPTMPLPSYARVTNLRNNYSMIVRVNDRGPYHSNRIMDVSRKVAEALDFQRGGTSTVKVEYVGKASLAGSDDARLFATLRTDGPARSKALEQPTMVAEAVPPRPARVASLAPYAPQLEAAPGAAGQRRSAAGDERPAESERHRAYRAPVRTELREETVERDPAPTSTLRHPASRHAEEDLRRDAHTARGGKPSRPVQMASRSPAETHISALREPMPLARPGRGTAPAAEHAASKATHAAASASHPAAVPPSRPVKLAAAGPTGNHHAVGMRTIRARDN